jgi:hypothetical protein
MSVILPGMRQDSANKGFWILLHELAADFCYDQEPASNITLLGNYIKSCRPIDYVRNGS